MSVHSWIRKLFGPKRTGPKNHFRWRPALEMLEDRLAPASFTVTDTSDNGGDSGSIRYAIDNLAAGGNTISFATGVAGTITLGNELDITQDTTITGPGASQLTISGNNLYRIFSIHFGAIVTISGLTLTKGLALGGSGGAIANAGALTLQDDDIANSKAEGAAGLTGGFGGGIANFGTLNLIDSTISGNTALGGAGQSNSAGGGGGGGAGLGGAIYNAGSLQMIGSTITGNAAVGGAGAASYYPGGVTAASGGAGGGADGIGGLSSGSPNGENGGFGGGGGYAGYTSGFGNGGMGGFGGGGGGGGARTKGGTGGSGAAGGTYGGAGANSFSSGGGAGGGGGGIGGAIFNKDGTGTLVSGTISGNTATGGAGGSAMFRSGANGQGFATYLFDTNNGINSTITFGAPSVTAWTAGQSGFSSTIAITGLGPFVNLSYAGLPPGLSASLNGSTITISGTPLSAGTFSAGIISVQNMLGDTGSLSDLTITINSPLSSGALAGTQWTSNRPGFSGTISVSGGTTPYTLSAQSGLPPGLTATLSGNTINITGTPTTAGTFNSGSVTVKDASGATVMPTFTITINVPLAIGALSVTQWTVSQPGFSGALPITGGTGPYTLSAPSGLPNGLTAAISGDSVAITGTPTQAGLFANGSVTVTDSTGATFTQSFGITINAALAIGSLTVTQWTQNQTGFAGVLPITGGSGPYLVTGFSGLPTGLTAVISGNNIAFSGAPMAPGTFSGGSVTIEDAADASATQTFSITINAPVSVGSLSQTQWTVDRPGFFGTLAVSGGTGGYSLAAQSGLPTGLNATLSGNIISFTGIPTAAGLFASGSVTVKDSLGAAAMQTFSITINGIAAIGSLSPTAWTVNEPYAGTLTITGGTGPYQLTEATGFAPGVSVAVIGSTIHVTGTPATAGVFAGGTVAIEDITGATTAQSAGTVINLPPALGSLSLSQWTLDQAGFTGALPISGGTSPYMVSAQTGLPTGLTAVVNGNSVVFMGTPMQTGTFASSVTITDNAGVSAMQTFSITINPLPALSSLTQTQWTINRLGFVSTATLSGGTAPLTLTAQSGLPTGLTATLNGATLTIAGTPTALGTFSSGAVTIKDAGAATIPLSVVITINPDPTSGSLAPAQWTVKEPGFTGAVPINGGTGPFTMTAQHNLPTGLSATLTGSSITFTGAPTVVGIFPGGSVSVKDATGATATATFSIAIVKAPTLGSLTVKQWTLNQSGFTGAIPISNGTGPFNVTFFKNLPPGLTPVTSGNNITFTGTPTKTGVFTGTITIEDSAGATVSTTCTITINAVPTFGNLSQTQWDINRAGYKATMAISGGTKPFTLAAQSGLPPGLTASLSGTTISITGTPTALGVFNAGSVTIEVAGGAQIAANVTITINSAPSIAALTQTDWTAGKGSFTGTMAISAGTAPFTIIAKTNVPPGMTPTVVNNAGFYQIAFTGAPTAAGTFNGSIKIQDHAGAQASQTFSLKIDPAIVFTLTKLPAYTLNASYSENLQQTTGGTGTVTYQFVLSAPLPDGMSLVDGLLSGKPTTKTTVTITVTATDSLGAVTVKVYTLSSLAGGEG